MRKIIIYCLLVSGILTLVCCQGVFGVDTDPESPTTFSATIGPSASTKTTLAPAGNSGTRAVLWSSGDEVFIGGKEYTLTAGAGTTSGTLEGSGAVPSEGVYKAYYPVLLCSSGTPTLGVQKYAAGRIDNLPMYAQSSGTDLQFYNLCAVLNLRLRGAGTVTEVEVTSTEHPLSGPFEVKGSGTPSDGWYAQLTGGTGSSNTVRLECTPGVGLDASDFFIALPAGTYGKGTLTVTVKGTGGVLPVAFTNDRSSVTLRASHIYGLATRLDAELNEVIAWSDEGELGVAAWDGVLWNAQRVVARDLERIRWE